MACNEVVNIGLVIYSAAYNITLALPPAKETKRLELTHHLVRGRPTRLHIENKHQFAFLRDIVV
jgi:hypothetical protein